MVGSVGQRLFKSIAVALRCCHFKITAIRLCKNLHFAKAAALFIPILNITVSQNIPLSQLKFLLFYAE